MSATATERKAWALVEERKLARDGWARILADEASAFVDSPRASAREFRRRAKYVVDHYRAADFGYKLAFATWREIAFGHRSILGEGCRTSSPVDDTGRYMHQHTHTEVDA